MKGISSTLRAVAWYALLFAATAAVVLLLQLKAPDRSIVPIADRVLCSDGRVGVGDAHGAGRDAIREITCVDGRSSDDITALTLVVLGVPCLLVLGTTALLLRRFLTPHQRSIVGQVRTT